jgi:hypothetical protein
LSRPSGGFSRLEAQARRYDVEPARSLARPNPGSIRIEQGPDPVQMFDPAVGLPAVPLHEGRLDLE